MKKNYKVACSAIMAALYTMPMHANIIWPALYVASAQYSAWFLIIISIIIEALVLRYYIPTISYLKALFVSLVGNAVSTCIGTIVMAFAMFFWHATFELLLIPIFHVMPSKVVTLIGPWYIIGSTFIFMYLGSSLIELVGIHLLFGYKKEQLMVPVLAGNLITYLITAIYLFQTHGHMLR